MWCGWVGGGHRSDRFDLHSFMVLIYVRMDGWMSPVHCTHTMVMVRPTPSSHQHHHHSPSISANVHGAAPAHKEAKTETPRGKTSEDSGCTTIQQSSHSTRGSLSVCLSRSKALHCLSTSNTTMLAALATLIEFFTPNIGISHKTSA